MKVNRESFLRCLQSVSPGLAAREIVEQSACFVFYDGLVATYNDEIACRRESPLNGVVGAVQSGPLTALLSKLAEEEVDVEQTDAELIIKGVKKKGGIRMEKQVLLPIATVEVPTEWQALNPEFSDAVAIVEQCAGADDTQFALTCVHIAPGFVEAMDNFQIARYPLQTGMEKSVLVRRDSLRTIVGLDMTEFAETDNWLHFRNPSGLMLSCRRYVDEYPSLDAFLETAGDKMTLPGGLSEAVEKAEVFSSENAVGNNVVVDLKPGKLMIESKGASGWYKEARDLAYDGAALRFMIAPTLLREICKRTNECIVAPGRLAIDAGKFKIVVCLGIAE